MKTIIIFLTLLLSLGSFAQMKKEFVEYKDGETTLEGYLVYDQSKTGKLPAVLIVHDWMGLNDFAKNQAEEIAKLGYVAFAVDVYGKGIRPKNAQEAGAQAGKYKGDRNLFRSRMNSAFDFVSSSKKVDQSKIGVMGFCFGGTAALELARSGANIKGVVSFHGGLDTPIPQDAKNIKGKILILHGADDPFVPEKDVKAFIEEMKSAGADWQLNMYSKAVHAYTNPKSGNDPSKGAAYNESAANRSMAAMKTFFKEVLGK